MSVCVTFIDLETIRPNNLKFWYNVWLDLGALNTKLTLFTLFRLISCIFALMSHDLSTKACYIGKSYKVI